MGSSEESANPVEPLINRPARSMGIARLFVLGLVLAIIAILIYVWGKE